MSLCKNIDRKQLFNLLSGMLGIYFLYFIAGVLHESLIKLPQHNRFTDKYEICENAFGLLLIPFAMTWLIGHIYNKVMLDSKVNIPLKNSALTAGAVTIASIFSILAIQKTSFTVVIMFQSCSILPVVFVGVFCSRVNDPNLKLGPKKIAVAFIVATGILIFQLADPESKNRQAKQNIVGIIFLLFHFVAEGFLPDLQAQIKVNYKPEPTEMMAQINKYSFLITLMLSIVTWDIKDFIVFLWEHPLFSFDLIIMSIFSTLGQFFVYRMIKQFKQHFVPFTISSRKILTVAISIVFYGHSTNLLQISGICIVLLTIFIQFLTEISAKDTSSPKATQEIYQLNEEKLDDIIKTNSIGQQNAADFSLDKENRADELGNSSDFETDKQKQFSVEKQIENSSQTTELKVSGLTQNGLSQETEDERRK